MTELGWNCKAWTLCLTHVTPIVLQTCKAKIGVCIKASRNNRGLIYFGNSDVDANGNGFELSPGDTVFLPIENAKIIYLVSVVDDDKASYFVV